MITYLPNYLLKSMEIYIFFDWLMQEVLRVAIFILRAFLLINGVVVQVVFVRDIFKDKKKGGRNVPVIKSYM